MKNTKYIMALAAAVLLLGSNWLFADGDQPWHFSYQIGGADVDDSRNTSNGDVWQGIGFGYFLGPNFSLDLEYDEFEGDYRDYALVAPGSSNDEWKLKTLGVVGRYYFGSYAWKPYRIGGHWRHQARKRRWISDRNLEWSLGLGVQGQVAKHWSVRGQVMWRRDSDKNSLHPTSIPSMICSTASA